MTTTLTLVGRFLSPWKNNIVAEIKQIQSGRWSPTTVDFADAAGRGTTILECESFYNFLGAIHHNQDASVSRVNVITHANRSEIAFSGTVNPRTGEVLLNTASMFSAETLDNCEGKTFSYEKHQKKFTFTIDELTKKFAKDAALYFYCCHSGVDTLLLQALADTLHAKVNGFKNVIMYCPKYTEAPAKIDRRFVGLGSCAKPVQGIFTLQRDVQVAPKNK